MPCRGMLIRCDIILHSKRGEDLTFEYVHSSYESDSSDEYLLATFTLQVFGRTREWYYLRRKTTLQIEWYSHTNEPVGLVIRLLIQIFEPISVCRITSLNVCESMELLQRLHPQNLTKTFCTIFI